MITINATITTPIGNETHTYAIDQRNGISIEGEIVERINTSEPSWGIISSNTGSIKIKGKLPDELYDFDQIRSSNVEISVNNTPYGQSEIVSTLKIDSSNYDRSEQSSDIYLSSFLTNWQDINIPDFAKNIQEPNGTAMELIQHLIDNTPIEYEYVALSDSLTAYFESINIKFPYLSGTLWQQWQDVCEAFGLYVYLDKNYKVAIYCEVI